MKKVILSFIITLLFVSLSKAQYFDVIVNNNTSTVAAGGQTTFNISVNPLNGFSASLYFSYTTCIQGEITFAKNILNNPYQGQTCTIKVDQNCAPGNYNVVVKGYNGNINAYDTINLTVTNSVVLWTLFNQTNSSVKNYRSNQVYFDTTGRIYFNGITLSVFSDDPLQGLGFYSNSWKNHTYDTLYTYDNCGKIKEKKYTSNGLGNTYQRVLGTHNSNIFVRGLAYNFFELNQDFEIVNEFKCNLTNPDYTNSAYVDAKGRIWLFGYKSIARLEGNQWIVWNNSVNGFDATQVFAAEQDNDGNFWIASAEGILKYDGQFWTQYSLSDQQNNKALSIVIKYGRVYGSTFKSVFYIENNELHEFTSPYISDYIFSIVVNGKNDIFASLSSPEQGGIARFKDNTWFLYNSNTYPGFPKCDRISWGSSSSGVDIDQDNEGNIWASLNGCGVIKFDPDRLDLLTAVSADKESNKSSIVNIFPNPSPNGKITLNTSEEFLFAEVFDNQGTKLVSTSDSTISGLASGFYLIRIYYPSKSETHKIIVTD